MKKYLVISIEEVFIGDAGDWYGDFGGIPSTIKIEEHFDTTLPL